MAISSNTAQSMGEVWTVVNTRPRREKRVAQHCTALGIRFRMPLRRSVRKYLKRTVSFDCPLFQGYVFLAADQEQARALMPTGHVARLCPVPPLQVPEFCEQLDAVESALSQNVSLQLAPEIVAGTYVQIRYGPLAGQRAWVQERRGHTEVLLRIDFIGQGALLPIEADALEPE